MNNAFFNNPIVKGIIAVILFALPLIITQGGSWQALTLGGVLTALYKAIQNTQSNLTVAGNVKR
jgi:hypothetical protein